MPKIAAFVQARMSSTRLPGKVLAKVSGKPVLQYVLERVQHTRWLDEIVVLTSDEPSDQPIIDFCKKNYYPCLRGDLSNVARRFFVALGQYAVDGFVRICADSPLLDPALIDRAVHTFIDGHYDLVTNVHPRTFPRGQSVEVVRADTFRSVMPEIKTPKHREHVTLFFYDHPDKFNIFNMESSTNYSHLKLTIDTQSDIETFSRILAGFDRPHWEYSLADILEINRRALVGVAQ